MEVSNNTLDQTGGPQMKCTTKSTEELVGQLASVMIDELGEESEDLLVIEDRLCEVVQGMGQKCLRQMLEQLDGRYPAAAVACECGGEATYQYRRPGTLMSHFGRVVYRRAYYLCASCHQGCYPLDQALGIEPGKVSARLSSDLAMLGVQTAFAEAAKLLKALLLVEVSPTTVQQETQRFGEYQMAQEKQWQTESADLARLNQRQTNEEKPDRLYG